MAMKNYLVEGVSGSGKTSVCDELINRGCMAIHGDRELAYQGDPDTGEPVEGRSHHHHIWHVDKVQALIADKSHEIWFFCGGSRNFKKFIDLFDAVFVLDVDDNTIKHRLATRQGDEWGKRQSELDLILRLNKTKEDIPSDGIVIDATQPLDAVVDEILKHANFHNDHYHSWDF